jgi:hypothetical protein
MVLLMSVGSVPNSEIWVHRMQSKVCRLSRESFCHYKQFLMILCSFFAQNLQVRCLQKRIDKPLLSSSYLPLDSRNWVSSIQFCVMHRISMMSASRVSGLYTDSSGLMWRLWKVNWTNLTPKGPRVFWCKTTQNYPLLKKEHVIFFW